MYYRQAWLIAGASLPTDSMVEQWWYLSQGSELLNVGTTYCDIGSIGWMKVLWIGWRRRNTLTVWLKALWPGVSCRCMWLHGRLSFVRLPSSFKKFVVAPCRAAWSRYLHEVKRREKVVRRDEGEKSLEKHL